MLQSRICRAVHRVTDFEKIPIRIPIRISKDEADEQQAHGMIPKTDRYADTSANKAKAKSLTRMPTAEKAVKERDCGKERKNRSQMPVAMKERTDYKCM